MPSSSKLKGRVKQSKEPQGRIQRLGAEAERGHESKAGQFIGSHGTTAGTWPTHSDLQPKSECLGKKCGTYKRSSLGWTGLPDVEGAEVLSAAEAFALPL